MSQTRYTTLSIEQESSVVKWVKTADLTGPAHTTAVKSADAHLQAFLLEEPARLNYRMPSYFNHPPLFKFLKHSKSFVELFKHAGVLKKAINLEVWLDSLELIYPATKVDDELKARIINETEIYLSALPFLPTDIFNIKIAATGQTPANTIILNALNHKVSLITTELLLSLPNEHFNQGGIDSVAALFLKKPLGLNFLSEHPAVYKKIEDNTIYACMHLCGYSALMTLADKYEFLRDDVLFCHGVNLSSAIESDWYCDLLTHHLDRLGSLTTDSLFEQTDGVDANIAVRLFTTENGLRLLNCSKHLQSLVTAEILNLKIHGVVDIPDGTTIFDYLTSPQFGNSTLAWKISRSGVLDGFVPSRQNSRIFSHNVADTAQFGQAGQNSGKVKLC